MPKLHVRKPGDVPPPSRASRAVREQHTLLAVDEETALIYAGVVRDLKSRGRLIGSNDLWIGSSSLRFRLLKRDRQTTARHLVLLQRTLALPVNLLLPLKPLRLRRKVSTLVLCLVPSRLLVICLAVRMIRLRSVNRHRNLKRDAIWASLFISVNHLV